MIRQVYLQAMAPFCTRLTNRILGEKVLCLLGSKDDQSRTVEKPFDDKCVFVSDQD